MNAAPTIGDPVIGRASVYAPGPLGCRNRSLARDPCLETAETASRIARRRVPYGSQRAMDRRFRPDATVRYAFE